MFQTRYTAAALQPVHLRLANTDRHAASTVVRSSGHVALSVSNNHHCIPIYTQHALAEHGAWRTWVFCTRYG